MDENTSSRQNDKPDKFKFNREIAYKGSLGRAREKFCTDYAVAKAASIKSVDERLRTEASSAGQPVTCVKGCSRCCYLFILASLQECECIVHYLYSHEDTLCHFMSSFEVWRAGIGKIDDCFRRLNSLQSCIIAGQANIVERQQYQEEEARYAEQDLPCPFLSEGCCSIYEVRPYVCAGVMSVSDPAWCHPAHPSHQQMSYIKAELDLAQDMPYFMRPRDKVIFSSMPMLVYHILENGWGALATLPGLQNIKKEAFNDPGMRAALKDAGREG